MNFAERICRQSTKRLVALLASSLTVFLAFQLAFSTPSYADEGLGVYQTQAQQSGWVEKDANVYYYDEDGSLHTGWLVSDSYKDYGLQRYWFADDGTLMTSALIDAADAGWWAYATPQGYVVRGTYDTGAGCVYVADNDGRLPDTDGWLITGDYTGGELQRYWIEDHAAESSYFEVDGSRYFGLGGAGYVLRGTGWGADGSYLSADNDGKLATSYWLITDLYGDGLQRYWYGSDGSCARSRLIDPGEGAGWWAYATPQGYVVRGKWTDTATGYVYLADNDGCLESTGWLITDEYDGAMQRYYIDATAHAAIPGYSADGYKHYTLSQGYVLRGAASIDRAVWYADNDGRLVDGFQTVDELGTGDATYYFTDGKAVTSQWIVTDSYLGYGMQRYWMKGDGTMALNELITDSAAGWVAYATDKGYVVRGKWASPYTGYVYLADNDGCLEEAGWVITDEYDDGDMQRYWIDETQRAAIPGYSTDGWPHLTLPVVGYVLRQTASYSGVTYVADNDGLITEMYKDETMNYVSYDISLEEMANLEHGQNSANSVETYMSLLNPDNYDEFSSEFYQFAVLNGDTNYCTADQLNAILEEYGQGGVFLGTGQTFIDAAAANNINAEYLLAHAILETGWGRSSLAQGFYYDGSPIDGVSYSAGTYYNFFGIGAYDSDAFGYGSTYAIKQGWNSIEAAIYGSAAWLSAYYINSSTYHQNTLYTMRWDVSTAANGGTPWHQYATGTSWATSIAQVMSMIFTNSGVTPAYSYEIPVYN